MTSTFLAVAPNLVLFDFNCYASTINKSRHGMATAAAGTLLS